MLKWGQTILLLMLALVCVAGSIQAKPVDIEVWFSDANEDTKKWIDEQLIPAFNAASPDIKAHVTYVSWTVFYEKLKVAFAAGTAPDLYQGGSTYRGSAAMQGTGMIIDKYTKNWPDKKDFFPASWDSVVWEGHDYGIPTLTAPRSIVYRADLLAEGGFNPEVNPTEWDDVKKTSLKLSRVDGAGMATRWGFELNPAEQEFWIPLLWQNGGQYVSSDGNTPLFNTTAGEEAIQWYLDFYQAQAAFGGKLPPGGFPSGSIVMGYRNIKSALETIKQNPDLKDDIKVGYPMKRKLQVTPAYTDSFFMSSQTKYPDQAWEFLKFFAKPENMTTYNETLGYFPPRKASLRTAFLEANPHLKDTFAKVIPFCVGRPSALSFASMAAALKDVFAGKSSPKAALENAAALWQKW